MPDSTGATHQYEDLARAALLEITPAATIGDFVGTTDEGDGVVSLLFASAQPGYPDWLWTVSVAQVEGAEPTVLEAELMPAEGALLAPDWVPWSDRLAEYKAAQAQSDEAPSEGDEPDDDDLDDDLDGDDESDDDDDLDNDVLHGGDLDGVDIDEPDLDDDDDDESDDDDDELDDDEVDRTY
ncbi:MAG: DUF3027 domain-containing protein [Salinibacterium sp.]|nr:DUF3027 domain-containing protein [Salinibacterium sp.]